MAERILIFGNGQIGNRYKKFFEGKHQTTLYDGDITDNELMRTVFTAFNPTVVINTAAKTNLEYCDTHMTEVFDVNVRAAHNLAKLSAEHGSYFIHLSSGCIFESKDKNDLKTETSPANPSSYYAYTKAWADSLITKYVKGDLKYLILRPRQPVSGDVNYKNILMKLLTFTKYIDTPNTVTNIDDLMGWTEILMNKRYVGIINAANDGYTTPYEIAKLLKKYILPELNINKISKSELDTITPVRRVDAILSVDLLKSVVGVVPSTKSAVERSVELLAANFKSTPPYIINNELRKAIEQTKTRTTPNEECLRLRVE